MFTKKHILVIILTLLIVCISISACGNNTSSNNPKPTEEPKIEINIPSDVNIDLSALTNSVNKGLFAFKIGRYYSLDSKKKSYPAEMKSYLVDGVVLIDAKMFADIVGFDYKVIDSGRKAQLTLDDTTITLTENTDKILINEQEISFVTVVKRVDSLLVDAKCLIEALGYEFTYDQQEDTYFFTNNSNAITDDIKAEFKEQFNRYDNIVYNYDDVECGQTGVGLYDKTPFAERVVGIAYSTWHRASREWGEKTWSVPLRGPYLSNNRDVIFEHGKLLAAADVDFVFIDWSNNTEYDPATMRDKRKDFRTIEETTDLLFEIWKDIPNAPKICILAGPSDTGMTGIANGKHQTKVDQIYRDYIEKEENKDMYFCYNGKPLLICYAATPTKISEDPEWTDGRFTVKWMTGFVGQQGKLFDIETKKSHLYWSWEERGEQTFTVLDGTVEAVTCTAASRQQGNPESKNYIAANPRNNGMTLKQQFQRAYDLGARVVLVVSWNEWSSGEQPSVEVSKDIEPSKAHGTFYYDLLREQIKKFKGKI